VLDGIATGDHAYFVHSFHFRVADPAHLLAHADYGGPITAIVGRDNIARHPVPPRKSQATGLRLIANFLRWFAFRVGLPGKSGVGGGILAIAPSRAAIAVWSPGLNAQGNSQLGTLAVERLARAMHWSAFG
jgi:hypothetical protein